MELRKTPIAAALCVMALASSPAAFAANDHPAKSSSATTSTSPMASDSRGTAMHGSATDRESVRQLQQALKDKGHDPGPIDGIMGPRTRAAMQAYQRQNNLAVTRGFDQRTIDSLGVQASASATGGGTTASGTGSASGSMAGMGSAGASAGAGTSAGGAGGSMSGTASSRTGTAATPNTTPSGSNASTGTAGDGGPHRNPQGGPQRSHDAGTTGSPR